MNIRINDDIYLKQFSLDQVRMFYNSIHEISDSLDLYRTKLQEKQPKLEDTRSVLIDAIENKFKLDGTPDFFIYYHNEISGIFEFAPLETNSGFVEVGYWLYRSFRRKGILSSVFPEMIKYAKNNFNRSRLIATTGLNNIPSQKLLERSGFSNTGRIQAFKKSSGVVEKDIEYEYILL